MRDNTYIKNYAAKAAELVQAEIDSVERVLDYADTMTRDPGLTRLQDLNPFSKTPLKKEEYPYDPVKAKELNEWLQAQVDI